MTENYLKNKLEGRILIIGDLMLDHFIHGEVKKISPEAPVPILEVSKEAKMLGGCGNVLSNLKNLGMKVKVLSVIGNCNNAGKIIELITQKNISSQDIILSADCKTNYKMRLIANGQHIVRADWNNSKISKLEELDLLKKLSHYTDVVDCVIISDYAKGVCTEKIIKETIKKMKRIGKPVLIDPKGINWRKYYGSMVVTPNEAEISKVCSIELKTDEDFIKAGSMVREKFIIENCLITRGAKGMTFVGENEAFHIKAKAKEVFDVTGAGDTVISCLAVGLINGLSFREAVEFSNFAAGIVVSHVGTSAITKEELGII